MAANVSVSSHVVSAGTSEPAACVYALQLLLFKRCVCCAVAVGRRPLAAGSDDASSSTTSDSDLSDSALDPALRVPHGRVTKKKRNSGFALPNVPIGGLLGGGLGISGCFFGKKGRRRLFDDYQRITKSRPSHKVRGDGSGWASIDVRCTATAADVHIWVLVARLHAPGACTDACARCAAV